MACLCWRRRWSTCTLNIFIGVLISLFIVCIVYPEILTWTQIKPGTSDVVQEKSRYTQAAPDVHRNCSKQLAILTPSIGPFKAWREYERLKDLFSPVTAANQVSQFELKCPKYKCNMRIGATLANNDFLRTSDGVVINMAPNLLKTKLPRTILKMNNILTKGTTWLFWGMESPAMFLYWDAYISNITYHNDVTYHSQSSLSIPYGYFIDYDPMDKTLSRKDWTRGKTQLISWMASNCENTFWPRIEFVHELQKFIPIDMYGKCGNLTCLPPMSPVCNSMQEKYKFYLALENAECDEYISEKFWDVSLKHGVVPVVYGGRRSAYEKLAPPNSFIHVGDFASTRELAEYLLMLDSNDDKYNKYFEWRSIGHVKTNYPPLDPAVFCDTIPLLLADKPTSNTVVSQSRYFNTCRGKPSGKFAEAGSLRSWSPWK